MRHLPFGLHRRHRYPRLRPVTAEHALLRGKLAAQVLLRRSFEEVAGHPSVSRCATSSTAGSSDTMRAQRNASSMMRDLSAPTRGVDGRPLGDYGALS
jgi:hypothetical protein